VNKPQHTPGPLRARFSKTGRSATIRTATDNPLVELRAASAEGTFAFAANVRLFAAAPAMFDLLREVGDGFTPARFAAWAARVREVLDRIEER
jgi:hypothetical protein